MVTAAEIFQKPTQKCGLSYITSRIIRRYTYRPGGRVTREQLFTRNRLSFQEQSAH